MAYRCQSGEWLFWFSLAAVMIVHAQLAYLVFASPAKKSGAIEMQTTAISINLEASDILDAAKQSASTEQTAAGSPGQTAEEIQDEQEPAEQVAEPETVEAEPQPESDPVEEKLERAEFEPASEPELFPEPVMKAETEPALLTESIPDEPPEDTMLQEAEHALERAMQAELKRREEAERKAVRERQARKRREKLAMEQERREQRKKKRIARNSQSGAGGASNSRSSSARISASTGAIRNYASMIRSRIARYKPSTAHTGGVAISISLTASGGLKSVAIIRSSGNRTLDRQMLSAVRRAAPFPRPPDGTSPNQSFTVQFASRR